MARDDRRTELLVEGSLSAIEQIVRVLESRKQPMRASEIAREIRAPRSRVNALLHANMGARFLKNDDDFTWTTAGIAGRSRAASPQEPVVQVKAHFAPHGQPLDELSRLLDDARNEVLAQVFYLRSPRIAEALIRAHRRGVNVSLLLGSTSTRKRTGWDPASRHAGRKHKIPTDLNNAGIRILEYWGDTNNHNKCVVIDGCVTVTGGLNLCDYAAKNADNLVVIRSPAVADQFRRDWETKRRFGSPFKPDE